MRLNKILPLFLLLWSVLPARSQELPKGYFQFPIQPGQINYLSGSMGEIRATHFHAGLDIKTKGREGLEVYAAADGYISRIRVSNSGYGNAIYLQHPNGYSTVYAHLFAFNEELAAYVRDAQYSRESFEIELYPAAGVFEVQKGQLIAYSGNTGSSGGPHLHFEVRNPQQNVVNPLFLDFMEVRDDIPPQIDAFRIRAFGKNSRVNGQVAYHELSLERQGATYRVQEPVLAFGEIGFEVFAHDKLNGSANKNGIYLIESRVNEQLVFRQRIDELSFSNQRGVLAVYTYDEVARSGRRFNKLYVDEANIMELYEGGEKRGVVNLLPGDTLQVEIKLADSYGNTSTLSFPVIGAETEKMAPFVFPNPPFHRQDHWLFFQSEQGESKPQAFVGGTSYPLEELKQGMDKNLYVWDLRFAIPDSLSEGLKVYPPPVSTFVEANRYKRYTGAGFQLDFEPGDAFYDFYMHAYASKDTLFLGLDEIPFWNNFSASFTRKSPRNQPEKWAAYELSNSGKLSYKGGTWLGNAFAFDTRNLGTYVLLKDDQAPEIRPLTLNKELISFYIKDEMSGVSDFRATLNGEWLLLKYESKKNLLFTDNPDRRMPFRGELRLEVRDNVGNLQTFTTNINE